MLKFSVFSWDRAGIRTFNKLDIFIDIFPRISTPYFDLWVYSYRLPESVSPIRKQRTRNIHDNPVILNRTQQ